MRGPKSRSVEDIISLTAQGKTAPQIAKIIGITKSRVYQLAQNRGFSLVDGRKVWAEILKSRRENHVKRSGIDIGGDKPPVPSSVTTGGIVSSLNTTTTGTIAEILAAADLMSRGWQVYIPLVRHRGHDLICSKGTRLMTVEVRSAHRGITNNLVFGRKNTDKSETYALVITGEQVVYVPALDMP